jgi:ribonuclease HII
MINVDNKNKIIIGIDEAGRGPLAGPVTVGVFGAEAGMSRVLLKSLFQNKLRDSKKLSHKKREEIYEKILVLKKEGNVDFSVTHISNKIIDKKGISFAIKSAIKKNLDKVVVSKGYPCGVCKVVLDGSLKAPEEYKNQKTIIKGDEKDVFIACASIVAKVSRDRLMVKLVKKYPKKYSKYKFEIHKGYGTALHRSLIRKHGLSDLHRKSFCKNIILLE